MRRVFALCILLGFFSIQVIASSQEVIPKKSYQVYIEEQNRILQRQMRTKIAELSLLYRGIESKFTDEVNSGKNRTIKKKGDMLKILSKKYNPNIQSITEREKYCIQKSGYRLFLEGNLHNGEDNTLNLYWDKIHNCSIDMKDRFTSAHLKKLEAVQLEMEMDPNSLFQLGITNTIESVKLLGIKGDLYFKKIRECIDGVINEFSSAMREKKRLFLKCMKIPNKSGKQDVEKNEEGPPVVPLSKNQTEQQFFIRQVKEGLYYARRLYKKLELNLTDEMEEGKKKTIEKKNDMLRILAKKYNASEVITEKEEQCIQQSGYKLFREKNLYNNDTNSLSQYWDKIQNCSMEIKENFTRVHSKALDAIQSEVEMGPHLMSSGYLDTIDTVELITMKGQVYYKKIREFIEKIIHEFVSSMRNKKRSFLKCMRIFKKPGKLETPDD